MKLYPATRTLLTLFVLPCTPGFKGYLSREAVGSAAGCVDPDAVGLCCFSSQLFAFPVEEAEADILPLFYHHFVFKGNDDGKILPTNGTDGVDR